jgi:predicted metal-dependent hydrolase
MPDPKGYTVEYRNVKHPRLEFKTGTLLVILPKTGWTAEQVLEKYGKWIKRKRAIIDDAIKQESQLTINKTRTTKELRNLAMQFAFTAQKDLSTRINKIYFRKMKTKWASHSKNNNLTINTLLKYLPEDLIGYIIYHETAHNIERKHNENFWNLINQKFPDHNAKENELLTYWFLIQKSSTQNNLQWASSYFPKKMIW